MSAASELEERIKRLEDKDEIRDLVVMYEVEGLSMREAADVLKIPLQTAYSRHKAAISTLRGLVQDTREGRSRD